MPAPTVKANAPVEEQQPTPVRRQYVLVEMTLGTHDAHTSSILLEFSQDGILLKVVWEAPSVCPVHILSYHRPQNP